VGTRRNLLSREIVVQNVKSSQPRVDPNLIQPKKWPFVEGIWVIPFPRRIGSATKNLWKAGNGIECTQAVEYRKDTA
jgi:hypothetical protein